MRGLIVIVLVYIVQSMDLEDTLKQVSNKYNQIKSTEFGRDFLANIQLNDPIDKIIRDIANVYNTIDAQLEKSAAYNIQFQKECKESLEQMKKDIRQMTKKLKDTEMDLNRKQPRYDLIRNRMENKKKMQLQLEVDSKRQLELRQTQNALFNYNSDQLDKAMQAITAIRNKFVNYLSQRMNRQRKAAKPSLIDEDDYDEEEEERQHYEKYVFVQIQVAIQKVSKGLEMGGITELMEGFQEICQQLHDIKEGNIIYDDTEETLNRICQQVIDVCKSLMDWIGQVRSREDSAEDAKHDIAVQTVQLIKKQQTDNVQELAQLSNEVTSLHHTIESMKESISDTKYSIENSNQIYEDKKQSCVDQDQGTQQEKIALEQQMGVIGTLLDLLEQKGGQFKKVLAQL